MSIKKCKKNNGSIFIKRSSYFFLTAIFFLCFASVASAHFGVILPSDDIVDSTESRTINLTLMFTHPFEQKMMDLVRPQKFGMVLGGKKTDLSSALKENDMHGHKAWKASVTLKRPGDHAFYFVPQPYWEPAEDCYIQHFTKVIVNAFGLEEGWQEPVGLEAEIIPLSRPYGLWTNNVFRGQVLFHGKPVPGAEVEYEYYNAPVDGRSVKAPADAYITQVVVADSQGVFTVSLPMEGWWGFAALMTDPGAMTHDGKKKDVEKGAVLWVRTRDMKR